LVVLFVCLLTAVYVHVLSDAHHAHAQGDKVYRDNGNVAMVMIMIITVAVFGEKDGFILRTKLMLKKLNQARRQCG